MGSPSNFVNGEVGGKTVQEGLGKWLGLMYHGGILVGLALALLFIVIVLSVERMITLAKATGKGRPEVFVQKIQMHLESGNIQAAMDECDSQQGTVGNVVKEALKKYKLAATSTTMDKEQKVESIKLAVEEATALELPMLEKHLTIIATIVSIATLVGLIGTVLGMIRAFAALGASGTPDAAALSAGISEALVNTATGISTSTISTVSYNYFTSRIDDMTYRIDEVGISIVETFKTKYN
jgi:biopolymer transport protein ExbB